LTIENVRKYEEENDPVDLKELMARGCFFLYVMQNLENMQLTA